jgi:hypothetical protein
MSAGGVRTHLASKRHMGVLDGEEGLVVEEISRIPGIIQGEHELDDFQFPSPTTKAIPQLAEPKNDGMRCKMCQYVSRHRQGIQEHCRARHGWKNQRKRGRQGEVPKAELPWDSGVRCQRFFKTRLNSRWFEVDGNKDRTGNWIDHGMVLVESSEDGEDGGSSEEIDETEEIDESEDSGESMEIEEIEGAVWIESSPAALGSGIVIGSSPPEFDLDSGMQSQESDQGLPRSIEARSQTIASSQTIDDLSRQPVCQAVKSIVSRTASRPVRYQPRPDRGYMPRAVIELIEYLEYWSEVFPLCPLCHLMEDGSDPQHQIEHCWREKSPEIGRAIQAMEKGMREGGAFAREGCCPKCGVPRVLDGDLSGHQDTKAGGRCKYEGVLIRGFVTMYVAGFPEGIMVLGDWFDRNLIDRGDEDAAMAWFRERVPWGGMEVVRVLRVFYMLSKKNVGYRYQGKYNMGMESIKQAEWIWRRYLE